MQKILAWLITSVWFKKYAGILGGIALGMWIQANYWKQIRGTLEIWGIAADAWSQFLLAIAGAAGIVASVGLTMAKLKQDKQLNQMTAKSTVSASDTVQAVK